MQHIMREARPEINLTGEERGWRNFVPRILYRHLTLEVLPIWQNEMATRAEFNVGNIQEERGHPPFSIDEFNDTFAWTYDDMLTSGDDKSTAIVFHSTPSDKYRCTGWFYPFKYGGIEVVDVPDPIVTMAKQAGSKTKRPPRAHVFWSSVCSQKFVFVSKTGDTFRTAMSLHLIIVGAMILRHHIEVKKQPTGVGRKLSYLNIPSINALCCQRVTPNHLMGDFFPSTDNFRVVVKNAMNTLKFSMHPYEDHPDKEKMNFRYDLCRKYVFLGLEGDDRDKEDANRTNTVKQRIDVQRRITAALNQRLIVPILAALSRGLDSNGASFLLKLLAHFDFEMGTDRSNSQSWKVARKLLDAKHHLPESLFVVTE
jgi:hypothetical protein